MFIPQKYDICNIICSSICLFLYSETLNFYFSFFLCFRQEVNLLKEKISGMKSDILTSLQQSKQTEYDDHKNTYQTHEQQPQSQSVPIQYEQQPIQTNYEQPTTQQRTFGLLNHLNHLNHHDHDHNHQTRGQTLVAPAQTVLYQTVPVRTIQRKLPTQVRRIKVFQEVQDKKLNTKPKTVRRKITRSNTRSVEVAERAIDSIKNSMSSAIWTGVTVVAVKLAPILLLGLKVRFIFFKFKALKKKALHKSENHILFYLFSLSRNIFAFLN